MLDIRKLNQSAEECLGWPYVSPGTNDRNGIDCSGLLVKMYRDQGASIYHGSNTIFREYCKETGKLTSEKQLQVGMVVFKRKDWTDADKNNKWYGKEPGNLSHIGYVASVNPLRIIHASTGTMCVTTDTKIGKWAYWGKLKDVDYGGSSEPVTPVDPEPVSDPGKTMYVYAENGEPVNFRTGPSTMKSRIAKIPVGDQLTVYGSQGEWSKAEWRGKTGWIMTKFLTEQLTPAPEPEPEPEPDPVLPGTTATVWSENGKPVKLRNRPSTGSSLYDLIPINTVVTLEKYGDNWCKVSYGYRRGWYIMTKYLTWG